MLLSDLFITEIRLKDNIENKDSYVYSLPVIKNLGSIMLKKRVTFFVGENGTGKSTLLEAVGIVCGFNAEGGSINFNFSTYKSYSDLYKNLKITRGIKRPKDGYFLRAESFYNVASEIEELDNQPAAAPKIKESYGGESLHNQSHGESFMSLIKNRFGGNGLYILDEPEAALSPSRQFSLISHINRLVKSGSQFIIATHSPVLMAYPEADIFVLSESGITLTPYEQTEHYILTRQFLENPKRMMRYLFEE